MNKTKPQTRQAKNKNLKKAVADNKIKSLEGIETGEAAHEEHLDPEVLKALNKMKRNKANLDSSDYVPELERGDLEEEEYSPKGTF